MTDGLKAYDFVHWFGYPIEQSCGCGLQKGECVFCQYENPFDAWCPHCHPGRQGHASTWHIAIGVGLVKCLACSTTHAMTKGIL